MGFQNDVMMTSLKVHFFVMTSLGFGRFSNSILWGTVRLRARTMITSRTFSIVRAFFVEFFTIHIHGTNLHGATLKMVVYDVITMSRGHYDVIITSLWRDSDVIGAVDLQYRWCRIFQKQMRMLGNSFSRNYHLGHLQMALESLLLPNLHSTCP